MFFKHTICGATTHCTLVLSETIVPPYLNKQNISKYICTKRVLCVHCECKPIIWEQTTQNGWHAAYKQKERYREREPHQTSSAAGAYREYNITATFELYIHSLRITPPQTWAVSRPLSCVNINLKTNTTERILCIYGLIIYLTKRYVLERKWEIAIGAVQ